VPQIGARRRTIHRLQPHRQQTDDDGQITDAVDKETPAFSYDTDEKPGYSGADQSGGVHQA